MTLKKKYFDQIKSGQKTEEYREVKPYWKQRIIGRDYDFIVFRNGYSADSPTIKVEYLGYETKMIHFEITGKTESVYALKLGRIVS